MKKLRKPIGKRQEKICEECKELYSPFPYKNETSKFCSSKCFHEARRIGVQICQECKAEFKRDRLAKYCGRSCAAKNNTHPPLMTKTGENHPVIRKKMRDLGMTWKTYNNWKEDKQRYRKEVWRITNQQDINQLENFDKPRTRSGVEGGFQLDHRISIEEGWNNKIDPNIIGSINNLQFIPWLDNLRKRYE